MRDPYEVLGVPRGASAAAIKSAYRKLAKKHHPDATRTIPKAAARFSELNGAYEIIGDEDKRKQFDRGEIDAEGKPRFQGLRLNEAAHGGTRRIELPNGKEVEFKIPAGIQDGKQIRLKRPGHAGPAAGRPATCSSPCRSRRIRCSRSTDEPAARSADHAL
jgi:DnaJ-class molecular chaperone